MSDNYFTLLVLDGQGLPPYSGRGITQTLDPIGQAANMRRTVNGDLKDISFSGFRKYKSQLSCNDQLAPALDGVWPGQTVQVDCISELSYKTAGGSAQRTPVPGSSRKEGLYTYYRPRLTMKVMDYSVSTDEYGAQVGWQLALEEI
jgi:hypothetical protein